MTLTEAIVVKVSHDLAGGIGAFANTVDLMKMDASFQQEGLGLLESTGNMLNARLKFFRALYGAENKSIDASLIKDYLKTLAVKIELEGKVSTRLQLAMIAVGIDILSFGGTLTLSDNILTIKGQEICCNPMYIQALITERSTCTPENVNALWLVQLVNENQKRILLENHGDNLILALT
ncbi:MAG: hypothetical protein J6Y85_05560 [Alphaproteobacteria bacterium]|nr:hypothetical protein [Alphaproteobacteria bacterium]